MHPKPKKKKIRVDKLLLEKKLVESIDEARKLIMAGAVFSENKMLDKAGVPISTETNIKIKRRKEHSWVSRGGIKLEHGIKHFNLDVSNYIAADIGCSTGGFTDVLLHNGASKVYSVDVGYGELAWKLRNDERVVLLERTNARNLTSEHINENLDIVVCDASFIGLKSVLPAVLSLCKPSTKLVALIKPQFEVQKSEVGAKGVVRDESLHKRVCQEIETWINDIGWNSQGITKSPIKGPEGNVEFLIYAIKQ